MHHFNPNASSGPCWHCTGWAGLDSSGCHALCRGLGCRVQATPARGCVYWTGEPGCDDEPGPPAGFRGDDGGGRRVLAESQ